MKADVADWPTKGSPEVNVRGPSEAASSLDDALRKSKSTDPPVGENMYKPRSVWFSLARESGTRRIVVGTYGSVWHQTVVDRAVQTIALIDAITEDNGKADGAQALWNAVGLCQGMNGHG